LVKAEAAALASIGISWHFSKTASNQLQTCILPQNG